MSGLAGAARTEPFRYAVIDLATAEALRQYVDQLPQPTAMSLFAPSQSRALLRVGPWLIRLSKAPEIEAILKQFGDHVAWGFYVHSTFDIVSLRQSLRHFNLVRLRPGQKEVLFRYWDPRVMRVFLDVATRDQSARLFELIDRIEIGSVGFDARGQLHSARAAGISQ